MKRYEPGDLVVLNEKAEPLAEYPKNWLVCGQQARILEVAHENRRRSNRWYRVELVGKKGNVVGRCRVPSNWLDPGDPS